VVCGILPYTVEAAWDLTPRELRTALRAVRVRERYDARWVHWLMVAPRLKSLPRRPGALTGDDPDDGPPLPTREEFLRRLADTREFFNRVYPGRVRWPEGWPDGRDET